MDTPAILKAYAKLVRNGITAWRLKSVGPQHEHLWEMEFETFGPLNREQCKPYVENYLKAAYQSKKVTFLVRRSHNDVQFYAQFYRGDL